MRNASPISRVLGTLLSALVLLASAGLPTEWVRCKGEATVHVMPCCPESMASAHVVKSSPPAGDRSFRWTSNCCTTEELDLGLALGPVAPVLVLAPPPERVISLVERIPAPPVRAELGSGLEIYRPPPIESKRVLLI